MGKNTREPVISEAHVEAAKKRVERELGRMEAQRELETREPHLYAMLIQYCNRSIPDESVSAETQTRIYDAIWRGMLVAVEAYRVAQFHLWAETCLGPQMEQLHPDIASRRFGAADLRRRDGEFPQHGDGNTEGDEPEGDDGATN